MGTYLNPGNNGFAEICKSDYVDKTGMLRLLNSRIETKGKLICVSRPRRFGKSYAAQMLCAYYDKSCDSHELFSGYSISKDASYEEYINKYHVINLDITGFIFDSKNESGSFRDIPDIISKAIIKEVKQLYPDVQMEGSLTDVLSELVSKTKTKIVFVIDEWDSVIREAVNDYVAKKEYLQLLRNLFKNGNFTPKVVAAAYMTGILPIKKDGTQSAISDFNEYSILDPGPFAEYVGFTEKEVMQCCEEKGLCFDKMKYWYDGYTVGKEHSIYNPYSVMHALSTGAYKSYWKKTSVAETLMTYIDMDFDGLQQDIARFIAGESLEVNPDFFQNDFEGFSDKDDVLTLLIHLGYLTYEEVSDSYDDSSDVTTGLATIPNEEVRSEFRQILRRAKHKSLIELVKRSDQLLNDTIEGKAESVAKALQEVHESEFAPTFYNNEQSLRYVIKMAYISCVDQYSKIEELPSGHGIADVVFLPRKRSSLPAMIIELKWNKTSDSALLQIKDRNYPEIFDKYGGPIVLVGVNYDSDSKEHSCSIETIAK